MLTIKQIYLQERKKLFSIKSLELLTSNLRKMRLFPDENLIKLVLVWFTQASVVR